MAFPLVSLLFFEGWSMTFLLLVWELFRAHEMRSQLECKVRLTV